LVTGTVRSHVAPSLAGKELDRCLLVQTRTRLNGPGAAEGATVSHRGSSNSRNCSRFVVLVVGGDARQGDRHINGTLVRAVASTKYGGVGGHRALIAAIRGGCVQVVILLARWLGHSESRAIAATCRAAGVRCVIATTGLTAARALADREVARG
jgi:hypothetical protein